MNSVVGDLRGNVERIRGMVEQADGLGAGGAIFPELAIPGYPPEDLVLKEGFVADNQMALSELAAGVGRCVAVVGCIDRDPATAQLHNAAAVLSGHEVVGVYRKVLLPNYAVFDEERYFEPGPTDPRLFVIAGVTV